MRPPFLGWPGETFAGLHEHRPCHVYEREVGARVCREDPSGEEPGARAEVKDSGCVAAGKWEALHHRLIEVVEARDELSARAVIVTRRRVECDLHCGSGGRGIGRADGHYPRRVSPKGGGAPPARPQRCGKVARDGHPLPSARSRAAEDGSPPNRGLLPQASLRSWEREPHPAPARLVPASLSRSPRGMFDALAPSR